jgi:multicomponent Na+:H+ antiporter subunit C
MILALLIGTMYAVGFYLLLRRSLVRLIIGVLVLGHASNLLIFVSAGVSNGVPIIPLTDTVLSAPQPDPLPQALVLTAIVIGLGVSAFLLALVRRVSLLYDGDDLDSLGDEL